MILVLNGSNYLIGQQDRFSVMGQAKPFWRLLFGQLFDPGQKLVSPDAIWDVDLELIGPVGAPDQVVVGVEALLVEQLGQEGVKELLVELVVNLAAVDALGQEGLHGFPRHLARGQVGPSHRRVVHPSVQHVARHSEVRLVELVLFGPAQRRVPVSNHDFFKIAFKSLIFC